MLRVYDGGAEIVNIGGLWRDLYKTERASENFKLSVSLR